LGANRLGWAAVEFCAVLRGKPAHVEKAMGQRDIRDIDHLPLAARLSQNFVHRLQPAVARVG
jgi:hypothetical protein